MFNANNTGGSQNNNSQSMEKEGDSKTPGQTIFNNVNTQNNIYINGPNPSANAGTNKINLAKDNVD